MKNSDIKEGEQYRYQGHNVTVIEKNRITTAQSYDDNTPLSVEEEDQVKIQLESGETTTVKTCQLEPPEDYAT